MPYPLIIVQGKWDSSSIPTLLENLSICRKTLSHYEMVHQECHSLVSAHEAWKTLYTQCTHLLVCSTEVTFPQNLLDYFLGIGSLISLTTFSHQTKGNLPVNLPIEKTVVCLPSKLQEKEPRSPIFHEGTFYHDLSAYLISNEWEAVQSFAFSLTVTSEVYPVGYCDLDIQFEDDAEIKEPGEKEESSDVMHEKLLENEETEVRGPESNKEESEVLGDDVQVKKEIEVLVDEVQVKESVDDELEVQEESTVKEPEAKEEEDNELEDEQPNVKVFQEKTKGKRKYQRRKTHNPDTPLRRSSRLSAPSPSK